MKEFLIRFIKSVLPLIGVAMFNSCLMAMYGCPHADFEAKGVVTDETGKGIKGIRVMLTEETPNGNYSGKPYTDTLWTNENGVYQTTPSYKTEEFAYSSSVKLKFEDVDGEENGGEFDKVEIEVPVFKVKEGDGSWYHGAYEAGANVTMNKK